MSAQPVAIPAPKSMTHHMLQVDLAQHLHSDSRIVLVEVPLGSATLNGGEIGRADVFTIETSYKGSDPTIYEVKASQGDLAKDLAAEKYRRYLPACARLIFAVGPDVKDTSGIPSEVGLIVRTDKGWLTKRKATRRNTRLDDETWTAILFSMNRRHKEATWRGEPLPLSDELRKAYQDRLELERLLKAETLSALRVKVEGVTQELVQRERNVEARELTLRSAAKDAEPAAWAAIFKYLGLRMPYCSETAEHLAPHLVREIASRIVNPLVNKVASDLTAEAIASTLIATTTGMNEATRERIEGFRKAVGAGTLE